MNSVRTKIIVDIFMTIFIILSFIRWDADNFAFHAVVGVGCVLFFALHVFIHRKWIAAMTKSCAVGKLNESLKWRYIIDILLLVFWSVSIVTGFIAIIPFLSDPEGASIWGGVHGVSSRIGLALVIVHIAQHLPQIKSYMGIKKQK